jgi:hypothetical protein
VTVRWTVVGLLALGLAAGCGGSTSHHAPGPSAVERDLLSGTRAIQNTHDRRKLDSAVRRVLVRLRRERPSTPRERRAKVLAIQGFELTRKGVKYLIAFDENDSGEVAAATRDAANADRYLRRAAARLRASGRVLGVTIGDLRGY